uniref:Zinc-alpha-2-glycoprotein-like isoform X2 n=1 Tax=Phascolarctos cinereus TaxID=38626 RepID=A0A6P5LER3_PHACI|nr:zinc-alpha-2-glycoprotein-like isoform X2 [Phascolarctos cinereus]
MGCKGKQRWFFLAWLLILEAFTWRETQAVHHRHVAQFTAVTTTHSLLELKEISFMDDIEVGSYSSIHEQIIVKIPWVSKAVGVDLITEMHNLFVEHEQHISWILQYFTKNGTNHNRNHTGQLLADCEIDNDIKVKSHIHLIWDGEEYCKIDEEVGHWENVKPDFKKYQHILESLYWTNIRKRYMNQYCVDLLRKIVGYSSLRDNLPPEVTTSRHVNPEGSIILSCTATGFYPRSILLHWEMDGKLGVWGKETSSGTLPNADSTFYLQVTLKLPPEDSGMGYICVEEHIELKIPAVYPEIAVSGLEIRHQGSTGQLEGSLPSPPSPTPSITVEEWTMPRTRL